MWNFIVQDRPEKRNSAPILSKFVLGKAGRLGNFSQDLRSIPVNS